MVGPNVNAFRAAAGWALVFIFGNAKFRAQEAAQQRAVYAARMSNAKRRKINLFRAGIEGQAIGARNVRQTTR